MYILHLSVVINYVILCYQFIRKYKEKKVTPVCYTGIMLACLQTVIGTVLCCPLAGRPSQVKGHLHHVFCHVDQLLSVDLYISVIGLLKTCLQDFHVLSSYTSTTLVWRGGSGGIYRTHTSQQTEISRGDNFHG